MPDFFAGIVGERIDLDTYLADFEAKFWKITEFGFWKLERQQFFKEPGYDAWEAFERGDWEESLRLLEEGRSELVQYHRDVERHGFAARRVRVVEEPLVPYMQWEMHALRIRDECGGPVRVVGVEQVAEFERESVLPEVCTLGDVVMYETVYVDGVLDHVLRTTDRDQVRRCQRFIADLYDVAEPLGPYFADNVVPLPRPAHSAPGRR